jgi:hypothetical protein
MYREYERCTERLVGNPERKRTLGRPSRKWDDNTEMDLKGYEDMDWNHLAPDSNKSLAFVNMTMKFQVP